MAWNQDSLKTIANLEFLVEKKNRDDLVKNGFKAKLAQSDQMMSPELARLYLID